MIRTKDKIYGEKNNERTCLTDETLKSFGCIRSVGEKSIANLTSNRQGLLITDNNGDAAFFPVPEGDDGKNKLLAVDVNGNLVWVDR